MADFNVGDGYQIEVNHPTAGSRKLSLKSGSDFSYSPGGYINDGGDDQVTTVGEDIRKKTWRKWMASFTVITDDNDGIVDYLQAVAESSESATWICPHINGSTRTGAGMPVDGLELNKQTGELPLTVKGGGRFEAI